MAKNNKFSEFNFDSEFVFITSPPDDDIPEKSHDDDAPEQMSLFTPIADDDEFDRRDTDDNEGATEDEEDSPRVKKVKPVKLKKEKKEKKEKKPKKELSTPAFIATVALKLLLICAVVAAMLAIVNNITSPTIAHNELEKTEAALRDIFPELDEYQTLEIETDSASAVYAIKSADAYLGYAAKVSPKGFGGAVNLIVGVDFDRNVRGIKVISHSETPAQGTKALDDTYLAGYTSLGGEALVLGADIDAVSGATITSKAVNTGVNSCLALYEDVIAITGEPAVEPEPEPAKAVFTKERVLEGMYGWEDNGNGVLPVDFNTDGTGFDELSYLLVRSDGSVVGYLAKIRVSVGEFDYADLLIGTYYGRIQGVRFVDYDGAGFDKIANSLHEYIVPNYKYDAEKTAFVYGENVEVFEEADEEARVICEAAQKVLDYQTEFDTVLAEVLPNE